MEVVVLPTKICARDGCILVFRPNSPRNIYCSMYCNQKASYNRRKSHEPARLTRPEEETPDQFFDKAQLFLDQHRPLPPIPEKIRATRLEEMGFDTAQEGVSLFSDLHWGSEIDPRVSAGLARYNQDIALERLTRWRNAILRYTQMSQVLMTLDTLHLFALGDDIEGHGSMYGTQKFNITESVGFQSLGFVDHMSNIILDLLTRYKKIRIYKVRGNHGRVAQKARDDWPPDNFELLAWNHIADRVRYQTGGDWGQTSNGIRTLTGGQVEFFISPAFMMFVEIMGLSFGARHGDGLRGVDATYTGLVDTKYRLNAIVREVINYLFIAHHHMAQGTENEIGGESIVNGCFVGPSQLSVTMKRPAANLPSQEFFLFHPRHHLTHRHRIHLATIDEMTDGVEWVGRAA